MQLINILTSGLLVKAVDVLCDHCAELPGLLHFRKLSVRCVRLRIEYQHLVLIESVKLLRVRLKERMADDGLRRILVLHMIEPVLTSKVRDAALRRYPGAAEKDNIAAPVHNSLKLLYLFKIHPIPPCLKMLPA